MPAHSILTGADLHEPKGADTASVGTVYVSNGAGSGTWVKVGASNIDATTLLNLNKDVVSIDLVDIGTAGSRFFPMVRNLTINQIVVTIDVTTATSATVLTFRNDAGNSMGTISIPSATAPGTVFSLTPVVNNTFLASTKFQIESDGGTSTVTPATVSFLTSWT